MQRACDEIRDGATFAVRTDIAQFFATIDRAVLDRKLERLGVGSPVRRVIGVLIATQLVDGASVLMFDQGVPQGSALSPVLSNVYLHGLDKAMVAHGIHWTRYGDDILMLARTSHDARHALEVLQTQLAPLGMALNARKTRRLHVGAGVEFLGLRLDATGATITRGAFADLHVAIEQEANAQAVLATWERWYGRVPLVHALRLPVAAAVAIQAAEASDGARVEQAAQVVLAVGAQPEARHWHVALQPVWTAYPGPTTAAAAVAGWLALTHSPDAGDELLQAAGAPWGLDAHALRQCRRDPEAASETLLGRGLGELARAVRRQTAAAWEPPSSKEVVHLLEAFACRYHLRPGRLWVETPGRGDHRSATVVRRDLTTADLQAHCQGAARCGIVPVDALGRVAVLWWRVHVRREALLPPWQPGVPLDTSLHARWDMLAGMAFDYAVRLAMLAQERDMRTSIEVEAGQAVVLWCLLDQPVSQGSAFHWMRGLTQQVGAPADELAVEQWPHQDLASARLDGPIWLPLSGHRRAGRTAQFVTWQGAPLEDLSAALLGEGVGSAASVRLWQSSGPPPVEEAGLPLLRSSRAQRVVEQCHVLAELARKSRALAPLGGPDAMTLLETLGHLPTEDAVQTLAQLTRWPLGETRRRLARRAPYPLSCPKLAARYAHIGCRACQCPSMAGMPAGLYPTPVLFGLQPEELPALRDRIRAARTPASRAAAARPSPPSDRAPRPKGSAPAPTVSLPPSAPPSSAPFNAPTRMSPPATKHPMSTDPPSAAAPPLDPAPPAAIADPPSAQGREPGDASKTPSAAPPPPAPPRSQPPAPSASSQSGSVWSRLARGIRRVWEPDAPAPTAVPTAPQASAASPPPESTSAPERDGSPVPAVSTTANSALGERLLTALQRLNKLRMHVQDAQRGLSRAEVHIEELFREAQSDRVRTSMGWVVREPQGEGKPIRYTIEI